MCVMINGVSCWGVLALRLGGLPYSWRSVAYALQECCV